MIQLHTTLVPHVEDTVEDVIVHVLVSSIAHVHTTKFESVLMMAERTYVNVSGKKANLYPTEERFLAEV